MAADMVRRQPVAPPGPHDLTVAFRRCWPALVFLVALPSHAQLFSFGVMGGVPITSAFADNCSPSCYRGTLFLTPYDRRYIIGPTAEVHLPFHLSIEFDALYRRNGFDSLGPGTATVSVAVDDWQIPVLAKYQIKAGALSPFVSGGVVYRHASAGSPSIATFSSLDHPNSAGVAVGGGVTLKLGIFRLSPQVRYTHWPNPPLTVRGGDVVYSTRNQADVLVGFTF
jgi:hypothetical protein